MFKLYFYGIFFVSICIDVFADQCYSGGVPFNGNYYAVNNVPSQWTAAESNCYDKLGHLASSPQAFTNAFLFQNISPSIEGVEFWLGGMINYLGAWNWTNANFAYTNWAPREPSSTTIGTCIAMNQKTGLWRAANCTEKKPYVCEMPKNRQWDSSQCNGKGDGWKYISNVNKCYFDAGRIQDTHFSFCIDSCSNIQADPLVILSVDEMNAVQGIIDTHSSFDCDERYMLPIHDPSGNGNYVWADGSNPNYTSWANPPPKGSCAFTFVQGQNVWIPSACEVDGVPINIICQYTPN